MGEWRVEILYLMEEEEHEEDHALTIVERMKDVAKSSALDVLDVQVTKEF
jgi:hypothetical protein